MLRFIRVYDADTTLEAILKGALSTTSSEYLRLDNHILASCSISVGIASFPTNSVLKLTDLLCYSFCLLCSLRIRAIRDPDAVLAQPSALHNVGLEKYLQISAGLPRGIHGWKDSSAETGTVEESS